MVCCEMNWYAEQPMLLLQRRLRTRHPFLSTGSASGSTTLTSMDWATSCVTTAWGFSSTTLLVSSSWLTESKSIYRSLHQRESLCCKTSLNCLNFFSQLNLRKVKFVMSKVSAPTSWLMQYVYVQGGYSVSVSHSNHIYSIFYSINCTWNISSVLIVLWTINWFKQWMQYLLVL